jgi:hypothetical protein
MSGVSYGTPNMSAFKKFDPYAAASNPKGVAPKVAKVPKVARPASHPSVTLGGLGILGGLAANIAKPRGSLSLSNGGSLRIGLTVWNACALGLALSPLVRSTGDSSKMPQGALWTYGENKPRD